ncbi:MAG TPA: EF-hand domain-containing protein, partial [Gemmata sp.]|nr:EF-hand domain-containing protein [Gemmata sp.]
MRPGQLKRVLSRINTDGEATARQGIGWLLKREYVSHLLFVATDPRGGTGGGGWYRPSESRYSWEWLSKRCDRDGDGAISLAEFGGSREWFDALDKDRDGSLTRDDFNWASDSPLVKTTSRIKPLFAEIDRDASGRITPDEWKEWFETLSRGKGYLSHDDFIPLLLEKSP